MKHARTVAIWMVILLLFVPQTAVVMAAPPSSSPTPTSTVASTPPPTVSPQPTPAYVFTGFPEPTDTPIPSPVISPSPTPAEAPIVGPVVQPTGGTIPTAPASLSPTPTPTPFLLSPTPSVASPTPLPTLLPSLTPTVEPSLGSSQGSLSSARIRLPLSAEHLAKRNYQGTEPLVIAVDNVIDSTSDLHVTVLDKHGNEVPVEVNQSVEQEQAVFTISPHLEMEPGKYTVKVVQKDTVISQQDFTWGVLAINTNKAVYALGETADIAIAVLDEQGTMVCNSTVNLYVSDPKGNVALLSTSDKSIIVNPECFKHDFTLNPDYEAHYKTGEAGGYGLTLTATTKNGTVSLSDVFRVDSASPFDISRDSATRIFPPKLYPMRITVVARQDFSGNIVETVPQEFEVSQLDGVLSYSGAAIVPTDPADKAAATASGQFMSLRYPFDGEYSQTLGFGSHVVDPLLKVEYAQFGLAGHDGVDFALPEGTPVLAVDDGEVIHAGPEPYGNTVIIQHAWGRSYYGHLSSIGVAESQKVSKGEQIALSGHTGLATGPHLHFGMRLNKSDLNNRYFGKVDPMPYLTSSSVVVSDSSVKKITWHVSVKQGETVKLGYSYRAPMISPQLYFLGPLRFWGKTSAGGTATGETPVPTGNPFVLGTNQEASAPASLPETASGQLEASVSGQPQATASGEIEATSSADASESGKIPATTDKLASESAQPQATGSGTFLGSPTSPPLPSNLVYIEGRQWQLASDDIIIQPTTIASAGTIATATKNSVQNKLVYDGTYWWAFYMRSTTANTLFYSYSPDLLTWTESSVALSGTVTNDGGTLGIYYQASDNSVIVTYYTNTNNDRYMRGAISGTTISWSVNTNYADTDAKTAASDYNYMPTVDSNGKVLYMDIDTYDNPRVLRSTNNMSASFSDTGASWTNLSGADATHYINDRVQQDIIIPYTSGSFIIVSDDYVSPNNMVVWIRYDGSAWTTTLYNTIYSGAAVSRTNWGMVKVSNTATYLLGQDTASSLTFRSFDGTSTWTTLTAPSWPIGGLATNSRVSLTADGSDVYAFVIRGDANNTIAYNKYSGGVWAGWADLTTTQKTRTYIETAYAPAANQVALIWTEVNGSNYDIKVLSMGQPPLRALLRHGEWFNPSGARQYFTW